MFMKIVRSTRLHENIKHDVDPVYDFIQRLLVIGRSKSAEPGPAFHCRDGMQ